MPYTLSHLAAALPARNSQLSFVAVAIGCLAPDLSYLFLPVYKIAGHTLFSLFYFSLPVSLLIYFWFQKKGCAYLLQMFPWMPGIQKKSVSCISLSILLGAASHIVWDSFTHQTGFVVRQFDGLEQTHFYSLPLYKWLQYFSSAGGLAVVVWALRKKCALSKLRWVTLNRASLELFILSSGLFIVISFTLGWSIAPFYMLNRAFFAGLTAAFLLSLRSNQTPPPSN